jgi:hypothetical protein
MIRLVVLFLVMPCGLQAQSVKDLFQRHWVGSRIADGDSVVDQLYSINVDSSWNYTGKNGTTVFRDGKKYSAIAHVRGHLYIRPKSGDVIVTLIEGPNVSVDELPNGGNWCSVKARFYLRADPNNPNQCILEGDQYCLNSPVSHILYR